MATLRRVKPAKPSPARVAVKERPKCDAACPQRAMAVVNCIAGPLYFCGHHLRRFALAFLERGYLWAHLEEREAGK